MCGLDVNSLRRIAHYAELCDCMDRVKALNSIMAQYHEQISEGLLCGEHITTLQLFGGLRVTQYSTVRMRQSATHLTWIEPRPSALLHWLPILAPFGGFQCLHFDKCRETCHSNAARRVQDAELCTKFCRAKKLEQVNAPPDEEATANAERSVSVSPALDRSTGESFTTIQHLSLLQGLIGGRPTNPVHLCSFCIGEITH